MGVVESMYVRVSSDPKKRLDYEKNKILDYLYKLKKLEAKLWGVIIRDISYTEEKVLEDTNHLVYLYSTGKKESLNKILQKKEYKEFLKDLISLKKDFIILKKEIREKEKLKLLVSNFTIKLVDSKNYLKFKDVFLLEKVLYDVLDRQDEELNVLLNDISKMKIESENKIDAFLESLKNIRTILSGHLDHHELFEDERFGYSNTSNILHELIKVFKKDID